MKILFMAREYYASLFALKYMLRKNVIPAFLVCRSVDEEFIKICGKHGIPYGTEEEFLNLPEEQQEIDYLFSFYWKLIKPNLLALPKIAAVNFHPGPLPEARGSAYHAAILNDWGYWGVTAHFMDAAFDTGDIIECRRFEIPSDIVNRDLVKLAHKELGTLFCDIFDNILNGQKLMRTPQTAGTYYSLKELEAGKDIISSDTEEIIERKIRAYWNPPNAGAQITIGKKKYTVINDRILRYISENTKPTPPREG